MKVECRAGWIAELKVLTAEFKVKLDAERRQTAKAPGVTKVTCKEDSPEVVAVSKDSIPGCGLRTSDPFNKDCVESILAHVTIGKDLTAEQKDKVWQAVREHADIFALGKVELLVIDGFTHKLHIPSDAKFSVKPNQQNLGKQETCWYYNKIDKMLKHGLI